MAPQIPRFAEYLAKGSPGVASFDASPPRAAEQGPGTAVPGSTCTPARALLGYLDWAVGSTRGAGSGDPDALAAATPEGFLSHVFSLVDATHDLRSRLQTSGPQGPPASAQELVESLDTLFDSFRELLRGHGITVVAPEPGRPLDPSTSRVAESVVRRDVPGETVVRVIRCGFKNALTGQVLRLAEVITAS